jgi:hypothetical protein
MAPLQLSSRLFDLPALSFGDPKLSPTTPLRPHFSFTLKPAAAMLAGFSLLAISACSEAHVQTEVLAPMAIASADGNGELAVTSASADGALAVNDEVVLPMQTCGDYFIADTMINGKGPFPMLLDTGAGTTVISPAVSEQIDSSRWLKDLRIDRFAASGKIPCKVQEIDHLSRALGMKIEGILAYGVFEGVLLTYDYPAQQIRVQKGSFDAATLASDEVVPTSDGTRPFIRASADGVDFTVLIDTGSSRGLTIKKLKRFQFRESLRPTGARMRINGLFIVESGRLQGDMKLGPLTLRQPVLNSSVSANLVGQDILRDFVITFDQVNHRARFQANGDAIDTPIEFAPLYGSGIVTAPRDDRLIVRRVFEGSAAEGAGIQIDDQILSINGTKLSERGCRHLEHDPVGGPKETIMQIMRGEELLEIQFDTQVLVP